MGTVETQIRRPVNKIAHVFVNEHRIKLMVTLVTMQNAVKKKKNQRGLTGGVSYVHNALCQLSGALKGAKQCW